MFSRREMRAVDRRQAAAEVPLAGVSAELARKLRQPGFALDAGGGQLRYPSLGLVIPQGRVCIELVLAGSGRRALERILAGYVDRPQVVAILLYLRDGSQGDHVAREVERYGLTDRTRIQRAVLNIDSS